MQPSFEMPTPNDATGTHSNGNSSAFSDWDYAGNVMPPSYKLPIPNHAPRTRSNSNASAFSDWDIFEAMVRNEENPTPIAFPNVDLDELFQITRPPPVAHGPSAPSPYISPSAPMPINSQDPSSQVEPSLSGSPISKLSRGFQSPYITSSTPTLINSQDRSRVAASLSRSPSISGLSQTVNSPALRGNPYAPTPMHGQVTSRSPSISGSSQHSPVYNSPLPPSLSRNSSFSGNSQAPNSPQLLNGPPLRRIPSALSRPFSMPGHLQVAGVNESHSMTAVHTNSPRHDTPPTSGSLSFWNSAPLSYPTPDNYNGQSSLQAQSYPPAVTVNSPRTSVPTPASQQPAGPLPPSLSRGSSSSRNSPVPRISGQTAPTRRRTCAPSRGHTVPGGMQAPNAPPMNTPTPVPGFLNGQVPNPHLSVSPVPNPLQYSENNKAKPSLKRARTTSSSLDGENVDPLPVRKKRTTKNISNPPQPFPAGTYEEIVPAPFDPKYFPDAKVDDIMETYKIKFESLRYEGNSSSMATPMRDCVLREGMKNPHDAVFMDWLHDGNREVRLVLTWPGYPYLVDTFFICPFLGPDERGITREDLAHLIGCRYEKLFLACFSSNEGVLAPQDPRWRIWNGGYTFDRLRLLSVERVAGNYWQASITVLTDHGFNSNPNQNMQQLYIE